MDLATLAFFVLIILFMGVFTYSMWTKSGRRKAVEMISGVKVVGEPFELGTTNFQPKLGLTVNQNLRLYECIDGGPKFYILENTQKSLGGLHRNFVKLPVEVVEKISQLASGS